MKVLQKTWRGTHEIDLRDALIPNTDTFEDRGVLEDTKALSEVTARAVGRLAALMVESGKFSFDDVTAAMEMYDIEPVRKG